MLTVGTILACLDVASAQVSSADPASGQQLARRWCAGCHMVEPTTQETSTDVAPSFSAVARMPSTTSMALRAFLQTPHGQMPDFKLSRDQIDDVVAYILRLRGE
jgi:mono/diheme cytochrome c family protein